MTNVNQTRWGERASTLSSARPFIQPFQRLLLDLPLLVAVGGQTEPADVVVSPLSFMEEGEREAGQQFAKIKEKCLQI